MYVQFLQLILLLGKGACAQECKDEAEYPPGIASMGACVCQNSCVQCWLYIARWCDAVPVTVNEEDTLLIWLNAALF